MISYITTVHKFPKENITILMDDKQHTSPTKQNILDAFTNLVNSCQAGDVVFCHFAGTYPYSRRSTRICLGEGSYLFVSVKTDFSLLLDCFHWCLS